MPKKSKQLRAAGYCRTSGAGQRDNTSIPRQREDITAFCNHNEWAFVRHYVDESKTGSKVEGRDEFQRMLLDAEDGQFDIIVPYDITRFGRDGLDIIRHARVLKANFDVAVVDTKGQFDTRKLRNTLSNYVHAGVSEHERLGIMERMIGGRIARAQDGQLWCGKPPRGRGYRCTACGVWPCTCPGAKRGKQPGEFYVSERGEKLRALLKRYVEGDAMKDLVKEFGFSSPQVVIQSVHQGQLSGVYAVEFNAPEIGIISVRVDVPAVPEVITPALERRVRARLTHNRTWNQQDRGKYLLTGFVRCARCAEAVTASKNGAKTYYRHRGPCEAFASIEVGTLDKAVLDFLYGYFLDEPAFAAAVRQAMPTDNDRKQLEKDAKKMQRELAKVNRSIDNLVNAIAKGADVALLLGKQDELKSERDALTVRLDGVTGRLAKLPDVALLEQHATLIRLQMMKKYKGRNWQKLPYDDVRQFLHFLFGDNPKKEGHGIFVDRDAEGRWVVSFRGRVGFHHDVVDGKPADHGITRYAEQYNEQMAMRLEELGMAGGGTTCSDNSLLLIPWSNCRPA